MTRLLTAALCLFVACSPARRATAPDDGRMAAITLEQARDAAAAGDHGRADDLFVAAAARYPDSQLARETAFWRAMLRLDPANRQGTPSAAVRLLDLYLASDDPLSHRAEALALRRLARSLDSLHAAASARPELEQKRDSLERSRERERERERELEREVSRLREALEKSNAELERIRRRLAAPPSR